MRIRYDPQQVFTRGGQLVLQLDKKDPIDNHNRSYVGMSEEILSYKRLVDFPFIGGFLTSWNKLCFTGGLLEGRFNNIDQYGSVTDAGSAALASVQLPGSPHINGLWVG